MKAKWRVIACVVLLGMVAAFFVGTGISRSDKSILRAEFDLPRRAKVVSYKAYPDGIGNWFGREGLEIDLVFQLSDRDYAEYVAHAEALGTWQPLPIPEEFLLRMGAVSTSKASTVRSYQWQGKPLPDEGSIYNPTEEQMLAQFVELLPPMPQAGLFQCRSAGTDIMHSPKTIHSQLNDDLNDFMLGILDHERKQLIIKVSTYY